MKTLRLNPAVAGILLLVLVISGCEHKKPVLVMPQQPPPATATPEAAPTPTEAETKPAEQQPPEAQPSPTPAEQPKAAEKTKHTRHASAKKQGEKSEVAHPEAEIPGADRGVRVDDDALAPVVDDVCAVGAVTNK